MTDIRRISPNTQLCMVIGDPVAHSLSPAIHNAAYAELGLDFVYAACRVEDVQGAMAGMRAMENFRGMSVTIPHKVTVMAFMDEIAPVDRAIGAINTVIHEPGTLIGINTDGPGAIRALAEAGIDMAARNVLMLGSGGAARAIAFTLARDNRLGQLALLDIDESMLSQLAADLRTGTAAAIKSAPLTPQKSRRGHVRSRSHIPLHARWHAPKNRRLPAGAVPGGPGGL